MTPSVSASYRYCESVARRAAGNFYHAFRILPPDQRRAMCALYAYMRVTDDLADEPGARPDSLAGWRRSFVRAMDGDYEHPLFPALDDVVRRYEIPHAYFLGVIDGVLTDLRPRRYERFPDLYRYCYLVASVVGLACIHVWGYTDPAAEGYAEKAGVALQLTNILRDLPEDLARGRVYLPTEDLRRFDCCPERLRRAPGEERFREMMRFQVRRAHDFYEAAAPLNDYLMPPGRAVFRVMTRTYRGLLEQIERRDYDVFSGRVRVGKWRKIRFVLEALPVRWGLLP